LLSAISDVEMLRLEGGVDEPSLLNLVVADGRRAVVTRFTGGEPETANSLYVHTGKRYVCRDRECRMVAPKAGRETVIVSSERLSRDEGWQRVTVNDVVTISEDLEVEQRPIDLDA
jgi:predicted glutamine amidotransferase